MTDACQAWYDDLSEDDAARVTAAIDYLAEQGPSAKRPVVGKIEGSKQTNLKELIAGNFRVLFAFGPDRAAILLVGGDKSQAGWKAWYRGAIKQAEEELDEILKARRSPK